MDMALTHIPCASPNQGEIFAREYLLRELAYTQGFLLTNYHHPHYNGTREHDLVLINAQGVWCLEVKNWHGKIKADQTTWKHGDDISIQSPITNVEIKAKMLASTLKNAGFRNISVVGMVVLVQPESVAPLEINDPRSIKVFRLTKQLTRAVTGEQFLYYPQVSDNKKLPLWLMRQISNLLMPLMDSSEYKTILGYRLERDLGDGELYHAYEGKHVIIPDRHARIKKYHLPATSALEWKEATDRFKQDMLALSRVANHPNVVRIYDYQPDPNSDDTYWLMHEWISGNTLRDWLEQYIEQDIPIPLEEQIRIISSLLAALEYCHRLGILHRNLNPANIYLADDGTVKLADFDYARVPDPGRTISVLDKPLIVNRYTAPELKISGRHADARSDLYSLGALWYDMAMRPTDSKRISASQLSAAGLPENIVQLLQRLLEPEPANRPTTAQEVRALLNLA
jgi:tRNA A-37 threonylcarbamoyl transferase component Bud32